MYQSKTKAEAIESYETREQAVKDFLGKNNWLERAIILPIQDKYGSALTDPTIEAIVVSPETEKVARDIVQERIEKGLSEIKIIIVSFVIAQDDEPVSSHRIRLGIIDRQGNSYLKFLQQPFTLPVHLREELQKPIGKVTTDLNDVKKLLKPESLLIAVGDIVTTTLLQDEVIPDIAIVDFRTRREDLDNQTIERFFSNVKPVLHNPAGTINPDFTKLFKTNIDVILGSERDSRINSRESVIIRIEGEEDLLTLPVILLAPLGTIVLYGQFDAGMVIVNVTTDIKQKIYHLLEEFEAK